jgi:uncharacterized protein YecE (DUF72 family)
MIKVGCCGFPTSMSQYFQNFNTVEINRTFYQYPETKTVEGWRQKAPEHFVFTVKAHQDTTHKAKMKIKDESLSAFERMKLICRTLNSHVLLFQTPGSFTPTMLSDAEDFFTAINREELALAWETRGPAWQLPETREKLRRILENLGVTHVTDPFRALPAYVGEVAYFRLHGLGERMYYYQYTDEELRKLKELTAPYKRKAKEVYIFFNNLAMFEDAKRFKQYLSGGAFPKITDQTGLASVKSVIQKTLYPTTKSVLIRKLGWRLVETEQGHQIRLETLVRNLLSKSYNSAEELLTELKTLL